MSKKQQQKLTERGGFIPTKDHPVLIFSISDAAAEKVREVTKPGSCVDVMYTAGYYEMWESYKDWEDGTPTETQALFCYPCHNLNGVQRALYVIDQLREKGYNDEAQDILNVLQGWLDEDYPGRLDTKGIPPKPPEEDDDYE